MKKITFFTFLCSLLLVACSREEWNNTANTDTPEAVFKLYDADYEGSKFIAQHLNIRLDVEEVEEEKNTKVA